ncbi:MAG: hypothetical protein K5989_01670 [Lachnospiraceae bacterium]|nr:hypothetical protein [Lachnospiraceae bacterium]
MSQRQIQNSGQRNRQTEGARGRQQGRQAGGKQQNQAAGRRKTEKSSGRNGANAGSRSGRNAKRLRGKKRKAYTARVVFLLFIALLLCLVFFAFKGIIGFFGGLFSGGESAESVSSNILEVHEDGSLTETTVEEIDTSEYDAEGLKSVLEEEINDYFANSGGNRDIQVGKVQSGKGYLSLTMEYGSAKNFSAFTTKYLELGDVQDLLKANGGFIGVISGAEDGVVLSKEDLQELTGDAVLINYDTSLKLPRKIRYVSWNVTSTGAKTAEVKKSNTPSIIIY